MAGVLFDSGARVAILRLGLAVKVICNLAACGY